MAKKIEKKTASKDADTDLEVLHPDRDITINGESITVREYGFVEGLRLRSLMQPLRDSLHKLMVGGVPALDQVIEVIAEHHETVLQLMAASIDRDVEWFDKLKPEEGDYLLLIWWTVCGPFFMRSVQNRLIADKVKAARIAASSAGETSTPPLSPAVTIPVESEATQSAN